MNNFTNSILKISIIVSLLIVILWSFLNLIILSYTHWIEPTIFADSYRLVEQNNTSSFLNWIFKQHNEHRIIFSKINTFLEVNILNLSPGQSGLFQNLFLILLSCGIWTYLNQKFFKDKNLKIITTLSGMTLLLHPWQWENFIWEFQVPWFFINVLVLLGTFLLIKPYNNSSIKIIYVDLIFIIIPWLSIFSTGQGLALALALSISSFIKNKYLSLKVTISSAIAALTFFSFFDYLKPLHHPNYNFDFTFFFAMLFGGFWHGLFVLVLITSITFSIARPEIPRTVLAPLSFPTLFSLTFTMMTTLSRSAMGLGMAGQSRYTTHTLMIGLSSILLLGFIAENNNKNSYNPLIGLSTLLITLGAFPQILIYKANPDNLRGFSFPRLWTKMYNRQIKIKNDFLCIADSALFKDKKINHYCESGPHYDDLGPAYFSNNLKIKPSGWHELHSLNSTNKNKNKITIQYNLDEITSSFNDLKIKGSVSTHSELRGAERFFIVSNYGLSNRKKIIKYQNIDNSDEYKNSFSNQLSFPFEEIVPLYYEGILISNITIETRNSSKIILGKDLINKLLQR